jgi:inosine-uridine nucleoside N-ribohydrolase
MKRKALLILACVVGAIFLLFILFVPAAPFFAKLGIKPICIQGKLPRLRLVACPETAATHPTATPRLLPTIPEGARIPVIFDDDGNPDGEIALHYFLRNPLFDVKAVTISPGEAHPEIFAKHLTRLLAAVGRTDLPVGVGRETPLEGENAFPEPWRQARDNLWDLVAAAAATDARLCPEEHLALEIVLDPGPDQGRTIVKKGKTPNTWVCLKPDVEQMKAHVARVLHR